MAGTSIGDKAAEAAARAIALASIRLYMTPALVAKAKDELKKAETEEYKSVFPENVKPEPEYWIILGVTLETGSHTGTVTNLPVLNVIPNIFYFFCPEHQFLSLNVIDVFLDFFVTL